MLHFRSACWHPSVSQPSWLQSLLRKKVTIDDLPEVVLLEVLSQVPRKDLVLNCRLVCSQWRDVVDLPALWKRKCQQMGFHPERTDGTFQDWKTFCFHQSKRNLVKNPCGEEGLDFWQLNGTQWATSEEIVLEGSPYLSWSGNPLPRPPQDVRKCFAFIYPTEGNQRLRSGIKRQRITLRDEGYSDRLMDEGRPNITVKDWQYPIWKSHCRLRVKLLSADLDVLQECCLESEEHGIWNELSHTFDNYPPGVRHIGLEHEANTRFRVNITRTSVTVDPEGVGQSGRLLPRAPSHHFHSLLQFLKNGGKGVRNKRYYDCYDYS